MKFESEEREKGTLESLIDMSVIEKNSPVANYGSVGSYCLSGPRRAAPRAASCRPSGYTPSSASCRPRRPSLLGTREWFGRLAPLHLAGGGLDPLAAPPFLPARTGSSGPAASCACDYSSDSSPSATARGSNRYGRRPTGAHPSPSSARNY